MNECGGDKLKLELQTREISCDAMHNLRLRASEYLNAHKPNEPK